jgi:hypothetical protein
MDKRYIMKEIITESFKQRHRGSRLLVKAEMEERSKRTSVYNIRYTLLKTNPENGRMKPLESYNQKVYTGDTRLSIPEQYDRIRYEINELIDSVSEDERLGKKVVTIKPGIKSENPFLIFCMV